MGYGKGERVTKASLQLFSRLSDRTRKVRNMGSAGLALAYLATGRFDAYLESGISLWDIAAGGFIIECAGGKFWREPIAGEHVYRMIASNGRLHRPLAVLGACQSCQ
jgi:myo-inositol-1(or 4)-monophosphatase